MMSKYLQSLILISFVAGASLFRCKNAELESAVNIAKTLVMPTQVDTRQKPKTSFTAADVAKLKWIAGDWRGMDGDKPFYERYRFEGTTMIVETYADETFSNAPEVSRFELKNGEFGSSEGERRSAASSITDDSVQFVPVSGGGNSFRFERQPAGKWRAVLEWPATNDKPARQKIYLMEPVKVQQKR
jgi:hypothetical protein